MSYLIDTHVLLWYLDGNDRLPTSTRALISNEINEIVVSIISLWEIAIKLKLKKLDTNKDFPAVQAFIVASDFKILNIKITHLNALMNLPANHNDPFDRLLIAQAIAEDMTLVSADKHFSAYPVKLSR